MQLTAASIFSSAICNLDCKYCYIIKDKFNNTAQKSILENFFADSNYIEKLQINFGDTLESLSLWGAEPTLTLDLVTKSISKLVSAFPKLKEFSFSTNLIRDPSVIYNFIKEVVTHVDSPLIDIQVSIDGPDYIHNSNRNNSLSKVLSNLRTLILMLKEVDLKKGKVRLHNKSTLNLSNVESLLQKDNSKKYIDFFVKLLNEMTYLNPPPNVNLRIDPIITLECPGRFTSEDGKTYSRLIDKMYEHNNNTEKVVDRYSSALYCLLIQESITFSCSAGKSAVHVNPDGEIHICHASAYYKEPDYMYKKEWGGEGTYSWPKSEYIDFYKETFIGKKDEIFPKFDYNLSGYHSYTKFRFNVCESLVKELAACKQIDPIFLKDKRLRTFFVMAIMHVSACPFRQLLKSNTFHTVITSYIRLAGNGAFQRAFSEISKLRGGTHG